MDNLILKLLVLLGELRWDRIIVSPDFYAVCIAGILRHICNVVIQNLILHQRNIQKTAAIQKGVDAGGLTPVKEEDAVMCCLNLPDCCQYF